MTRIERYAFIFLLLLDTGAILVSMISGPLDYKTTAIASAISACIISLGLIAYSIYFWRRKER